MTVSMNTSRKTPSSPNATMRSATRPGEAGQAVIAGAGTANHVASGRGERGTALILAAWAASRSA